jgi:cell division protein FtsA
MALPPVVALEIGTSKVVALVGDMREDNHIMITGIGEQNASGVRKGEIIDPENVGICVRSAVSAAEENGKVAIREVLVALSGGHIRSVRNRGTVPVLGRGGEISDEDIEAVMDVAKAVNLPSDREVLHTVCQDFCVDDQEHVLKPEGMVGARLALDMLVLHGVRNRLQNTVRIVRNIPLGVHDVAFGGLCAALAVLTPEQKKGGVAVIDLGGGTTDYVAYAGNVLATAGALGIGGDHVTNDLVMAFNIPISRAERLKREAGSAVTDPVEADKKVSLPAEVGFPGKTVRLGSVHQVVNARMDEIFGLVRRHLETENVLHQLGAGIVLTGGGAHLANVCRLAESVFGLPCSIGKPRNVSGLATATDGPEYAACCGLIQYGFRTVREDAARPPFMDWLRGIFGR